MADKNIKVVNFDQLELLLKYAVALTDANASGKFLQSDQYFLSTEGGKLTIYNGAGTIKYDSSSAFSVLEYVKKVEWWGSDKEHDQYSHTFIGQDDEGQSTEYHIEKIEKIDSSESTTYLPYIRIGANVYKIPVTTLNGSANNAPSFYAPVDAGTNGQYLTSSGTGAPVWASFPAFIASISYDGTNYRYRFLQSDGDYFDIPQADWNAAEGTGAFIRNKPTIPAAQVNSDWNAASGVAEILNKPTIPTITLNGNATTTPSFYAPTSAGSTAGQYLKWNGSAAIWDTFPTIPTITLNGSATTSPSFYAVTSAGSTAGQYLKWDGSAIVWDNFPTIPDAVSGTDDGNGNWATITIGSTTHNIPAGGGGGGGMSNPMTTSGDMIYGGNGGTPTRLAKGTDGQYLSLVSGVPTWVAFSGLSDPTTTAGDIIVRGASVLERLAKGSDGQVLTMVSGAVAWQTPSGGGGMSNPMTDAGDIIYGGSSGTPTRLAKGTAGQVLAMNSGATAPEWVTPSGGEPAAYIKDASVSNGVLTLTKKDNSTVTFSASQVVFSGAAVNTFTCSSIANGHAFLWTGRHNGQGGVATIIFTDSQFGLELEANFNNGSPWVGSKVTFTKNSNTSISTTANWDWGGDSSVTTTAFVMLY